MLDQKEIQELKGLKAYRVLLDLKEKLVHKDRKELKVILDQHQLLLELV